MAGVVCTVVVGHTYMTGNLAHTADGMLQVASFMFTYGGHPLFVVTFCFVS